MAEIKIRGDISGSTTIKAPDSGSDEVIELSTALGAKAPLNSPTFTGTVALPSGTTLAGSALTSGKILQVVRATDTTTRTTTSTSFVDANLSVTITPQKSDSAIILFHSGQARPATNSYIGLQITDSSNNVISGSGDAFIGATNQNTMAVDGLTVIGYATPATTSAVTYKLRFRANAGTAALQNANMVGQLFAIEVAA